MVRTFPYARTVRWLLVVATALLLSVSRQSGAIVQAGFLAQLPAATEATTHVLSYQGRLADPATGAPKADGSYSMTFRIYDAATAGTTLWTEIKDVTVSKGLFSTLLGDTAALASTIFDGNDRWLGVKVLSDTETTPRMRMAFVPYASWSINAGNLGGQNSAFYRNANNLNAGTVADARIADFVTRDTEVMGIVTGADGTGSGLDADFLDGQSSAAFAAASHNHSGANITSGTVVDARIDPAIARDSEVMGIVTGSDGAGSGLDADAQDGMDSLDFAKSGHAHSAGDITAGNLATDRFSALADLNAEGSIGAGAGQVAQGSHTHTGLPVQFNTIDSTCLGNISFGTTFTKVANIGSFTKVHTASTMEVIFNGRIAVITSLSGSGARFELRVDDTVPTVGRGRASFKASEVGSDGRWVTMTGFWAGLAAGSHTVSMWVAASSGTGNGAMLDPGCWSSDVVITKEYMD
ncbi:MAG TPA: hypothetical protein PL105_06800 [Caldilineaceae bacterium]|nr:hypothetical protein [Caldilineaceae bacterium]